MPLLALVAVLAAVRQSWGAELLLILLLGVLPGVLLLRALRVPGTAIAEFPVYVPAASLVVLIVSGIAVDAVGLLADFRPLRTVPLLIGFEVSCVVLLVASLRAPARTAIPWGSLGSRIYRYWPLLIPLAVAAGALRLNDGHGSLVAELALCACLGAIVWGIAGAQRLGDCSLLIILYAVGLAVMWGYSLRGDIVYGFDISTEYHALHETVLFGNWHFSHPGDAYGALPAVTVLPAALHFLTGVSDLMVLKLVYPVITAMFPLGIFSLARRVVQPRWAFVAASFIVAQDTFGQELSAVARQEIAMVLFIALLGVLFDPGIGRLAQWVLSAVFGVGMALSHYSTTYFAIGMIALVLAAQLVVSLFRDVPHVTGAFAVAFVATAASAAVWYGPVTHSASNVSQFASLTKSQGFNLLPNSSGGNLISSYLNGNTQASMSAAQYQSAAASFYATNEQFVTPLADANQAAYDLRDSAAPEPPVRYAPASNALSLAELIAEQLAELLGAVGAIIMALRKKTPVVARQLALLGAVSLAGLAAIRLSGTIAQAYNQQRALVQAFAVLAITMAWTLQSMSGWLRRRRWGLWGLPVTVAATAATAVLFAEMSGLAGAALGGGTATNLASSGEDYERYYTTVPEIAAAQWLGGQVRAGELVYADRYAELRLNAETSISNGLLNDVTPQTLDQGAWVYASQANIVDGRARQLFENHAVTYAFPSGFLDANFDLVYTNGASEVFRG
jgi:uncharacterized membrane protein